MDIRITRVDYNNAQQACDLTSLLKQYAQDSMGGAKALKLDAIEQLCPRLAKLTSAHSFICYSEQKPIGLINCFEGFSTFNAKPLLNIHDVYIDAQYRGLGLSKKLLKQADLLAKELNCCKITLEVRADNAVAQQAYKTHGFEADNSSLDAMLFWQKNTADT
ncbi:MAG: GNAT family N-acetyltransferase [Sinobacterium sp.]|nr:GNAT family N-acetyltransferase [Sinobacterium sp.]